MYAKGEYLGVALLKLVIAGPLVRFFTMRDQERHKVKPIRSRWYLQAACLISLVLMCHPFVDKPLNFFDRFNTIVSADPSTVYQQFMRGQVWLDQQLANGGMTQDQVERKKNDNERIYKRIKSSSDKLLYIKFGDIIDFNETGHIEEPSFLYVTAHALTFVGWMMGAVLMICHFLPPGGHLSILILLICLFAVEMEARFVSTDSLFGYFVIISEAEWPVFEAICAIKEAMVGVICGVIVLSGIFGGPGDATKTLLRNLLRTNAGVVTTLKDENIKQLSIDPDEPVTTAGINLAHVIARSVGALVLLSSIFLRSTE